MKTYSPLFYITFSEGVTSTNYLKFSQITSIESRTEKLNINK